MAIAPPLRLAACGIALSLSPPAPTTSSASEPDPSSTPAVDVDRPATPQAAAAQRTPQSYMGRAIAPPMHFSGAGWLTRPERVREEDPARMLQMLKIEAGQTVCDFGCGNGYHTLQLAKRVGPQGMVYAIDIQPEMLELLAERAAPRGLENIKAVLPTDDDPGMPAATFDLVLMVDVYHELSTPEPILATVRASLKPEGRLALVEFREEDPEVPILPMHKMSQSQVMKELSANKFKLVGQFHGLPWQHLMVFGRDDSPLPAVAMTPWQPTP